MKYDVDYFIEFFSQIPKERWCTGTYSDGHGRMSALGHAISHSTITSLTRLLWEAAAINDGRDRRYQQPHPRARVINALLDIKEAQR